MKKTGITPSPLNDFLMKTKVLPNTLEISLEHEDKGYVIDKLVGHIKKFKDTFYQVHWYGYGPADDTLQHKANISRQFIIGY